VLENVLAARDPYMRYGLFRAMLPFGTRVREEREHRANARHCLDMAGLAEYEHTMPDRLPYGLRKRLEIARALAAEPDVLLMDEPAAGLNPTEVHEFIELIRRLHEQNALSIMLIEHRMRVVMEMSDLVYVLNFGELIAGGTPDEVRADPEVARVYMGEENDNA
jgi:branched-chain amino acid transport system ATP-binding protein